MKIGLIYPQTELGGDPVAVREIGLAAEALGFDHLLAYDHVLGATHDREPKLNGPYTEKQPFHDPLVMFGYLSAITRRIGFATGVLILPQRQTALVARQAADVALLSDDRLRLGVGLGWNYVEYEALGQDFASRGKRVSEQVELLRKLWSEPLVDFTGAFDRVDRAADAFAQAARLRDLLDQEGRAKQGFGLQCNMLKAKSPEQVVETALRWREAGGTHAAFATMGQGMETRGQHLGYIESVADALRKEGMLEG